MKNFEKHWVYRSDELIDGEEEHLVKEGFTKCTSFGSYGVEETHWVHSTHFYTPAPGESYNFMLDNLYLRALTPEAKAFAGNDLCDDIVPQD